MMSATADYLQLSHQTKKNRFPKIFESAKSLKPDAKRILSFGCSTGEEAYTLAELFPDAEVVGVDIDHYSIQTARRNNKYTERIFFHDTIGATGNYDLVTCLMVLFSLESPIPWDKFDRIIKEIDPHINSGGLFMLYTCDYDPARVVPINEKYDVINSWKRVHDKNKKEYFCGYYRKRIQMPIVKPMEVI
jgi:2-polyprenyl-3-methyl-5-hydroxy-6-metoxy-1,4-benzoquinol methylase